MAEERVYLKFSKEINGLLGQAGVDVEGLLRDEIRKEGIDARTTWGPVPVAGEQDRDVVLILLAAALSSTLVATAVSRVITAVAGAKRSIMKERLLRPALDGRGQPIRDSNGNVVYELEEKPGAQPPDEPTSATKVSVGGTVLEFELTSGNAKPSSKEPSPKKKTS